MTENASPAEDQDGSAEDNAAPAIGDGERQPDGGPGSHTEDSSGGDVDDAASGGVPERADSDE